MLNKLWMIIDLQLPLVKSDINTFLLQDGEITQDDLNNFNNAEKIILQAYEISETNPNKAKELVNQALQILENIKPKKPFPPEMRIRFEELKSSLKEILTENIQQSPTKK
ncbi:hypothetical protein DFR86_08180 [Acidianus sulfidivorans JP7]|uniref:Uncharacterized protein n=1 Tax=Acidianus sulfidivorans JP7 TaxID=619593 RepID=A0A2U9IQI9_9CREN|nr:hypothetical protein DFR86_08180 [Acidianus sulfidivorans JP7]